MKFDLQLSMVHYLSIRYTANQKKVLGSLHFRLPFHIFKIQNFCSMYEPYGQYINIIRSNTDVIMNLCESSPKTRFNRAKIRNRYNYAVCHYFRVIIVTVYSTCVGVCIEGELLSGDSRLASMLSMMIGTSLVHTAVDT